MIPDLGGVDYEDHHAMIYGNHVYDELGENDQDHHLEIFQYQNTDKEFSNTEIEAFFIAKDILDKIEHQYLVYDFDLGHNRSVTYQDFCIILDRGTYMPLYKKIFETFHIPLEIYKDSNLTEGEDILVMQNIIQLVLAIYHEQFDGNMRYYFVSIARSFLGNREDEDIFNDLESNLMYQTDIYLKAGEIAKSIDHLTPSLLLERIIQDYDYYQKLILKGNIKDAMMRIDYLLDLASSMESIGYTIEDFLDYLNQMIDTKTEIRYKEGKSTSNSVKIMNIHKSKGLEFPVCYFAGIDQKFNLRDLQNRFLVDATYGILTPFYQEGIGTLFTKELIKNKYMEEEIAEKIRLFYVALTRAKEKMIMVMPAFLSQHMVKTRIDYLTGMKYRSFYDFLTSISLNLSKYVKTICLEDLSLSKDYEFGVKKEAFRLSSDQKMEFRDLEVNAQLIQTEHASKTIQSVIDYQEAKTLEYGTKIHEMLEETDFKHVKNPNSYVKHLLDTFDFLSANIYQELEFMFMKDQEEYHGIIDLMLEYEDEIKIIDYKLKNIEDDAYQKQLSVYYEYIRSVSDKKISLYLYSIMDNKVKEVEALSL